MHMKTSFPLRLMSLLFAVLLTISSLPSATLATELSEEHLHTEECMYEENHAEGECTPDVRESTNTSLSGRIGESNVEWSFDTSSGRLIITGNGNCDRFSSADDQPWASFRTEITEVWFNDMDSLAISDLAFWFDGCSSLTMAEIPYTSPIIGDRAFANCPNLCTVLLYHETEPLTIAADAFLSETLAPLNVCYSYGYDSVTTVLYRYDWGSDQRAAYFSDVYSRIALNTGYCSECGGVRSYTLSYEYWTASSHSIRHWCSGCGMDQNNGFMAGGHTYDSSGYCTLCGYYNSSAVCQHTSSYYEWFGCDYYVYCSNCGVYLGSGTSHGPYTYDAWQYYNTTYHSQQCYCISCGESSYNYNHHTTITTYMEYNAEQHSVAERCTVCSSNIGAVSYANHFDDNSDGLCDDCGYLMTHFSVTIPSAMIMAVSEDGVIHTADDVVIINNSTNSVEITSISITATGNWTLVPYNFNMAAAKVDSKLIGFYLNGAETTVTGSSEELFLPTRWTIDRTDTFPLEYNAVVSASSTPMENEQVLTLVFVVDWASR